jgi:mannosyltransferase
VTRYGRSLAGIAAAGAVLRLALLARQPLGYDEDFTAAVVVRPLGEMLNVVSRDSAPPLFYVAEWLVAQLSRDAAALRLVPALAGIALIPLLAALARRVAGDAAGLWAAAFAAVLPATLLVSLNARMYAPAGTLVVAAALLGWRAVERPSAARWAAYGLAGAAAVWTDYFAAPALLGVLAALACLRPPRRTLAAAAVATGAAIAAIAPWLLAAREQLGHAGQGFWTPPFGPTSVAGTLAQLFAGPPIDPGVPGREILQGLQVAAILAGCGALLAAAAAVRRMPAAGPGRRAALFLPAACGGVVLLAAAGVWRPLFEARYAGIMWLPLFALAGVGLAAIPRRAAALLVAGVAVPALALSVAITHPQTEALLPDIESRVHATDLVATDPDHYLLLLSRGSPTLTERLHVLASEAPAWYFGTAAYPQGAVIAAVPADVIAAAGTVFWVAGPDAAPPPLPPGYGQAEQKCVIGACLSVFTSNAAPAG